MDKLCIIIVSALIASCLSDSIMTPEDPERIAKKAKEDSDLSSEEDLSRYGALDPDDFFRGEQETTGDIHRATVDPIPNSGMFEGDIDLRGKPISYYVDNVIDASPYEHGKDMVQSSAIRGQWYQWVNAEVPYELDLSKFSTYDRAVIAKAINEYNKYTCIRWVPRRSYHENYVRFVVGPGCFSSVGRQKGIQYISLGYGCVGKGTIIHEMMHALGFFHEQSRTDRDDYVYIVWDNVKGFARGNFNKLGLKLIDDLGTNYDYGSIMHYGPAYFSKNFKATIVPRDPNAKIGQRDGLSETDIVRLNKLYKCPYVKRPRPVTTPRPGARFCADNNDHCDLWAKNDHCRINPQYMQKNCRRSCKKCGGGDKCFDKHSRCETWKDDGYCSGSSYSEYMNINCRKSCNKC